MLQKDQKQRGRHHKVSKYSKGDILYYWDNKQGKVIKCVVCSVDLHVNRYLTKNFIVTKDDDGCPLIKSVDDYALWPDETQLMEMKVKVLDNAIDRQKKSISTRKEELAIAMKLLEENLKLHKTLKALI